MTVWNYQWVHSLTHITGNSYMISEISSFYSQKRLTDDDDGNPDGIVAVGDPLSLYLHPFDYDGTLLGLGSVEGVAVQTTSPSNIFFLGDVNYSAGDIITLTNAPLTMCFAEGTRIATPGGETPVQFLDIGQTLRCADGRLTKVLWVGKKTLRKSHFNPAMQPVRISAGALGGGLPETDLTVTADHGMVIDGLVINASALVNGTTIAYVPWGELEDTLTVYHIETEHHDVVLANGAPSETYLDMPGRQAFENFQEYLDLYGTERMIPEMDMPRVSSARLLPPSISTRLASVAGADLRRAA